MNERIPDVSPVVEVSIDYGKHVNSLEVDVASIVQYLRDGGASDIDIENLRIKFTNKDGVDGNSITFGTYESKADTIEILPMSIINNCNTISEMHLDGISNSTIDRVLSDDVSKTLRHELSHKLARNNEDIQQQVESFYSKSKRTVLVRGIGSISLGLVSGFGITSIPEVSELLSRPDLDGIKPLYILGVIGIANYVTKGIEKVWPSLSKRDLYMNDPEEIHVRKMTDLSDEMFVRFQTKSVNASVV